METSITVGAAEAIYLYRDGQYLGPYTPKELRRHWANGVVMPEDLVWQEGMAEWLPLRSYFGIPSALATGAIPRGTVPSTANLQAQFAAMAGVDAGAPGFEYKGHPASREGWVIFTSWSLLGLSMIGTVIFHHNITVVLTLAGMAFLGALLHTVRIRTLSSAGLVVASLVLPALLWWLAHTFLPKAEVSSSTRPGGSEQAAIASSSISIIRAVDEPREKSG
jgi:hypothetical protein